MGIGVQEIIRPFNVREAVERSDLGEEPVYFCDLTDIIRKHINWTQLLPRVAPFYAVKCNDSSVVLGLLAALGASFDCASQAEIKKIKDLNVPSEKIIYANPTKPAAHLKSALAYDIRKMTFDSAIELHKIQQFYPTAELVLRIRCDAKIAQCPLGNKYGCDPVADAPGLLLLARELGLRVIGISFHVGSGCMDAPVYGRAIYTASTLFRFAETIGYKLTLLDIGGGFPGDKNTDIVALSEIINSALAKHFDDIDVDVIAEPGRYYVSSAYTLVTRIHSKREIRAAGNPSAILNRMYFINDGVYGSFNCTIYDHQVVVPIPVKTYNGPLHASTVWGPTCDGLDQVCSNAKLPDMDIDDLIMFENMGAYTLPIASPFNGFPLPIVQYYIDRNFLQTLRRSEVDTFIQSVL